MRTASNDGSSVVADLSAEEVAALDLAGDLRDRVQRERLAARALRDYLARRVPRDSRTWSPSHA